MPSSRLDNLRLVDPVLTTLAQSYANGKFLINDLLPTIQVKSNKGKIPVYGRDSFVIHNTDRAVRANSNRIAPIDFQLFTYETQEKDIEVAIDYIESEESSSLIRYEQKTAKDLIDILELGKEKEIADYLQNPANYANDMKTVLTESNAFNNYGSSDDPVTMIQDAVQNIRARTARDANTIIMGEDVYRAFVNNPALANKLKFSSPEIVNLDVLKLFTGVENIIIGKAIYSENGTTFSDIWKDSLLVAYIDRSEASKRSEFNPSLGYVLQKEGHPELDVYYENGGKIKVIRATDNYTWKITAPDCVYLFSNAIK